MSDRGRSHRGYIAPDPFYDNDHVYERPPRRRSLGRQVINKLEDAMGALHLDDSHRTDNATRSLTRYHGDNHHHHHHHRDYDDYDHYRHSSRGRHHPHDRDYHGYADHRTRTRPRSRPYHSASPARRPSHHHHHHHSRPRSRSRSRSGWDLDRGIHAAVDAAAIEAFRLRNEPGRWKGAKGERVATAAISAGVIGAATAASAKSEKKKKGVVGSALGGLVVNRLVNGPRGEVR